MSAEAIETKSEKKGVKTRAEKQAEHQNRITRTLVACFMGIIAGGLSFYLSGAVDMATGLQPTAIIGAILLLAGIVFQKHVFMLIKVDYMELRGKDWFYQGFMTFALWLITWTFLLTSAVLT